MFKILWIKEDDEEDGEETVEEIKEGDDNGENFSVPYTHNINLIPARFAILGALGTEKGVPDWYPCDHSKH